MRLLIICALALVASVFAVEPPVFPDQYTTHGVILLPYAELSEPFAAYYDGSLNRSRIDYYGDLMITLQKSAAADKTSEDGSQYKIVWEADEKGVPKRVCFKQGGEEGEKTTGQNLIPDLDGFTRIGNFRCPIRDINRFQEGSILKNSLSLNKMLLAKSAQHRGNCELWKKKVTVQEKVSTYSFWFRYDPHTNKPIPVTYEMSGYNSLLGSHFDHYIIHYNVFREGLISEDLFDINTHYSNCGPMPGPGNTKARKLLFNPMKAYFSSDRKDYDEHFEEFKGEHKKEYANDEEHEERKKIFLDNTRFIFATNRRNKSFKLAVNHLADKSEQELSVLRGRKVSKLQNNGGIAYEPKNMSASANYELPESFDWRILGATNPVKDQAICGSCWSFGTTGSIEGVYFAKTGKLVRLSEQQLIDCSWTEGNNGCDGGEDFRSYNYMMKAGGLATEEDYGHYLGVDGKCHANDVKKTVQINGFYNVTQYSVDHLKHALFENGPVTIAINAGVRTFSFYSNGVYYDKNCKGDPSSLNHQVLLVGFGKVAGEDYWLVKNSWSTYWGNDGYIMISQKDNMCGVTTDATFPIIKID